MTQRQDARDFSASQPGVWARRALRTMIAMAILLAMSASIPLRAQDATPAKPLTPEERAKAALEALQAKKEARQEKEAALGKPAITVDLPRLLKTPTIYTTQYTDEIWTIEPRIGWKLLLLPVRLDKGDDVYALNSSTLNIRSGRLLAWRIPEPDKEQEGQTGAGRSTVAGPAATDELRRPPMITREVRVHPDGKITWEMDRTIFGGEVRSERLLYALKLNKELLEKRRPQDPNALDRNNIRRPVATTTTPRPTVQPSVPSGVQPQKTAEQIRQEAEARRQEALRKAEEAKRLREERIRQQQQEREQQLRYRADMQAYTEVRDAVNDLPDEFEQDSPGYLWAVIEIQSGADVLTVEGASAEPWTTSYFALDHIRSAASGNQSAYSAQRTGDENQMPPQLNASVMAALETVKKYPHPFNIEMSARMIAAANAMHYCKTGDSLYQLADIGFKSSHLDARRIIVKEVVSVIPPTEATEKLFKDNANLLDPTDKLIAVKSKLQFDPKKKEEVAGMLGTANRQLSDPTAPRPGIVLEAVLGDDTFPQEAVDAISRGINFAVIPPDRRDEAIIFAIENAPKRPVAAGWVDTQLLGSSDTDLVFRTVDILSRMESVAQAGGAAAQQEAEPKPAVIRATGARGIASSILAPITRRDETIKEAAQDASFAKASAPHKPMLAGKIGIASSGHGLFRALRHNDSRIPTLAWRGVRHFAFVAADPNRRPQTPSPADAVDPYTLIVDLALQQRPTPVEVVPFLDAQSDRDRATMGLVRMTILGEPAASTEAARRLMGTKAPLDAVILKLPEPQRQGFAERMYDRIAGNRPLVTGLTRERVKESAVNKWFAQQIMAGKLPHASQWAEPYGNGSRLVEMIASSDSELSQGALAALVAAHGGDENATQTFVKRFAALTDKSIPNIQVEWTKAKQELVDATYKRVSGAYLFYLAAPQNAPADHPIPQAQPVELGNVELMIDANAVTFKGLSTKLSVPSSATQIMFRLDEGKQLAEFPTNRAADLKLTAISGSIDLMLQPDGRWKGDVRLPDGAMATLVLQPLRK